ncbi:hypothetical protein NDI52_30875 [Leptolyngbya sp. PL-A3]|uniref:hypothetical protein n=1 Tax=Leptolyngbya sp. PL-A3 TaxID=2933911 RepID=UPI003299ACFD
MSDQTMTILENDDLDHIYKRLPSDSHDELQSREFAPIGRQLSALKPENSPLSAGYFQASIQNENC